MAAPALDRAKQTRVRASKKALETVLDVLASKGLAVEKVRITGAQVEFDVGGIEDSDAPENDGGLKQL